MNLQCFRSINIAAPTLNGLSAHSSVSIETVSGEQYSFLLKAKYERELPQESLSLLRVAFAMPMLNYGLFTDEIVLHYPISKADFDLLNDLLKVFSADIFINKLVRRKNLYVKPEFLPAPHEVTLENAKPRAKICAEDIVENKVVSSKFNENACGVLSSGGKESLLTFAMLKEAGADVYALYVNESGGHWRTALPAYRFFKKTEPKTRRVWTNVDRFYNFMLDHMRIIKPNHREIWADTYPIRLCIFPVYVFLLLPLFSLEGIGNLLIGSEFDDPRIKPYLNGIRHYFGVYDQTQDFDSRMAEWYKQRMPGLIQWSAVRPISGLIVERILTKRYPQFASVQRSCHSCRVAGENILPCGKCSKCLGVLLFLCANDVDPLIMGYGPEDVKALPRRLLETALRLDEDEKEHALFLAGFGENFGAKEHAHVEAIHIHPESCNMQHVPARFRHALLSIMKEYTKGFTALEDNTWVFKPDPFTKL